ncbi:AAA family ATPase [Polyangium fumosum]|uniref:ATP-binding protein n=1 Tax=Polyangium fumosum TaxID=889272 RepID=A0A4U1J602_9BACT|nr:ATP-binding protein [Polyangium fumosum]TKD01971.1 ATP-binding protein [Polyangium fumosum]
MLRSLKLVGVGPAPEMEMEFGRRINVMTGDNGLGKSFVLDVIWWALSGTWAGWPAWPRAEAREAKVTIGLDEATAVAMGAWQPEHPNQHSDRTVKDGRFFQSSTFDVGRQEWVPYSFEFTRGPLPVLVLCARVDGTIALWDPARNHHKLRPGLRMGVSPDETSTDPSFVRRPPAYIFSHDEVLYGQDLRGKRICNGLVSDWVSWQQKPPAAPGGKAFAHLRNILEKLSPNPEKGELIRPGAPVRLFVDDAREFPTINTGYGDTAIIHASSGMIRVISLAYLIVWAWHEHVEACRLLKQEPVKNIVFLMDEVENHLHPEWQRRILPALLKVLEGLGDGMQVQAHITTHAPMVLASLEPHFDPEEDKLFVFDLERGRVNLRAVDWARQGDASRWLTSPALNVSFARSVEAERAIKDANAFLRGEEPEHFKTREEIDLALSATLADMDPFWPRWLTIGEGDDA